MLFKQEVNRRLQEMVQHNPPANVLWPEMCGGSINALVIFVGPSPGGSKETERRPRTMDLAKPLWNKPHTEPLSWSRGFKSSFKHIIERIFELPYQDASKLIAILNMDWLHNPESADVSFRYMWEGCSHILPIINQCNPQLVIPMDEKTFGVLQIALFNNGYEIIPVRTGNIKIRITDKNKKPRYHHKIKAFIAEKDKFSFSVIKSFQHPARVFDEDYANRVGQGIHEAFSQIMNNEEININLT